MIIVLYIFLIPIVIGLIIWTLWVYESKIPELEILKNEEIHVSISNWLEELSKKRKFNGIALLMKNNEVLFDLTLGYKTHTKNSIDKNTKFRLASVSKQYTAFGVMVLVKKYRSSINYETSVSKFINSLPEDITVRNLLNQTSGITLEYSRIAKKHKPHKEYILSIEDATSLIVNNLDDKIKPDKKYYYCNSNYILLARLIEIISNKSFEEYMKSEVFIPLDLNETRVWNLRSNDKFSSIDNIASGFESYFKSKPIEIKPTWIDGVAGDGGIFTSLKDLEKWFKIWQENSLLTADELKEAYIPPTLENKQKSNYGFGWVIDNHSVWHNGKWLATNSILIRDLKNKIDFVMVDNSSNIRFNKITRIIFNLIIKNNEN